ncbi:protein unc-80 homolog isoform 2-T2 [Anomaloglossus baeobatrachus]
MERQPSSTGRRPRATEREEMDERIAREEFRRPRESLLNICTEFYKHCSPRLKVLQNLAREPLVTSLELLDVKSHMSNGFFLAEWSFSPC